MNRILGIVAVALALAGAVGGCGGDDGESQSADSVSERAGTTAPKPGETARGAKRAGAPSSPAGTTVRLVDSDFGQILFDSRKQAIYIFERDQEDKSNCYGECAEAWPPVFTRGEPRAGEGVDKSLLGTTKRRDGKLQVTYAGKPLYYYAHEGPGEVKCHNVNLNGGFWWVLGADGDRIQ